MSKSLKRIVFISPYDHHGAQSGARKRVEALSQALLARKKDLHIICVSPWVPPIGVEHVRFSLEGSIFKRLLLNLWLSFGVGRLRPDLVISESPIAPVSFKRFVILHMIHDAKFVTEFARRRAFATRLMHWASARIANKVVTVSQTERFRICSALNIPKNRVAVSYNGISDAWLTTPLPDVKAPRKFDLLYVSNFAAHKGHISLLESLHNFPVKIAFVGVDFGEMEKCIELVSKYEMDVTFLSNLTESELINVYDNSKAFIFPSKLEGFGMPYIEARSRGLPVLANDIPVFRELQKIVGGVVINFENNELLLEKLRTILDQDHKPVMLDEFRWEYIAMKLIEEGRMLQ